MPSRNNGGNVRQWRINEEISKEITNILRKIKDPRIKNAFISIVRVNTTPDLKFCKIYYSVFQEKNSVSEEEYKEIKKGLDSALGFIRHELCQNLNLRVTPQLTFIRDESMEYGAKIYGILKELNIEKNEE